MTHYEKLDEILSSLNKKDNADFDTEVVIMERLSFKIDEQSLEIYLQELINYGFVNRKQTTFSIFDEVIKTDVYRITLQGLLFLEKTSFINKNKQDKIKYTYTIAKITLTAVSSLAIIILTFLNYKTTDRANDNKQIIDKNNSIIYRLTKSNDSLLNIIRLHTFKPNENNGR